MRPDKIMSQYNTILIPYILKRSITKSVLKKKISDGGGEENGDSSISSPKNPWKATAPDPLYEVENKITSLEIPMEVFEDSEPLWRDFAVGYFIGDAPHVGSIHATVNRIWTAPGVKGKIYVQFIDKNTVLFRIDNEALRKRVIKRRYWHISDVPLVLHE